jgi:AraC-like DNA-binding protein
MVSSRCKMIVKEELKKLGLHYTSVGLGGVEIVEDISVGQRLQIKMALSMAGFELMDDKRSMLVEKVKNVIIDLVHYTDDELLKTNFSDYLAFKLNYDYNYLSNLFSEEEGITIEHFILLHKTERVKELISNNELNFSEIAWKLHYSSLGHLSNQFKKITGLTPSFFKALTDKHRISLENV